jgi:hypothetical protein
MRMSDIVRGKGRTYGEKRENKYFVNDREHYIIVRAEE